MEHFKVEDLKNDYEASYQHLSTRWEVYAQRGYDIIDKVQKDGLLFVGINPSFDESFVGACASVNYRVGLHFTLYTLRSPKAKNSKVQEFKGAHKSLTSLLRLAKYKFCKWREGAGWRLRCVNIYCSAIAGAGAA